MEQRGCRRNCRAFYQGIRPYEYHEHDASVHGQKTKKTKERSKNRDPKEQETIRRAKELLMERNNMSEGEAHRYLQKSSMDSGTNMVETAEMVLSIMAE